MLNFLVYLRKYKKEAIIGPLFKLLEAVFELITPIIVASIVDIGVKNADTSFIITRGLLILLMGVLGYGCSLTAQYFNAKAAAGFGTELRETAFSRVMSFSRENIEKFSQASTINRLTNDITTAQNGVNMFLRLFLRSPFIVIGSIVMSMTIDLSLSLIFIGVTAVLSVAVYYILKISVKRYAASQKALDKTSLLVRESLKGTRVIRAFSKQSETSEEFSNSTLELYAAQVSAMRLSSAMNPLTLAIVNIGVVVLLYLGAGAVFSARVTQGEIIALSNYMTQMFIALIMLANFVVIITRALASSRRIAELLKETPALSYGEETQPSATALNAVELHSVSYSYDKKSASTLKNLSFFVKAGEFIGIIGGTGSGKTTLMRLLTRSFDAKEGKVMLFGRDIKTYDKNALSELVSVVSQRNEIFSATVRENLTLGRSVSSDDEIVAALKAAQAWDFVEKMGGLSSSLVSGGKNLSGGQKQRLTIARALLKKPKLLLLDDAVSALDYRTERELLKAVKAYFADTTIILVTQRTSSLAGADRTMVLENGSIVGFSTHAVLYKTCPRYRDIYDIEHDEVEAI